MNQEQKTIGEIRVRTDFNVSGSDAVDQVKTKAAELINIIEGIPNDDNDPELERLKHYASYEFETGAMWAVKALTAKM